VRRRAQRDVEQIEESFDLGTPSVRKTRDRFRRERDDPIEARVGRGDRFGDALQRREAATGQTAMAGAGMSAART
jgi:hypothetical protein